MYYAEFEFSVYFLKLLSFFFLAKFFPQLGILQIDGNLDICDYNFHDFFFKMFTIQVLSQIWSQNFAKIILKDCYTYCMPNFLFS